MNRCYFKLKPYHLFAEFVIKEPQLYSSCPRFYFKAVSLPRETVLFQLRQVHLIALCASVERV